ncbi:MAG: phosphoribosylformylglycinamidine synthase subunit PurL [Gemmataceae bacterium]
MLWEIDIRPYGGNVELQRIWKEFALLTKGQAGIPGGEDVLLGASRGYLVEIEADDAQQQVERLFDELLIDSLVDDGDIHPLPMEWELEGLMMWTVLLKPGVTDPVSQSVLDAARDLDIPLSSVKTFRRYMLNEETKDEQVLRYLRKVLANDAIEHITEGGLTIEHLSLGQSYVFEKVTVPVRELDAVELEKLSRDGQLALNLLEMQQIQKHFEELDRDPTDVELETIAQTWSEHCSHKTLKGTIDFEGRLINNLLKETIFGATQTIRERLGDEDWCVSVFEDNAGIVEFDDEFHACFKVETHNRPSAIEPYGGANTGIGGVIRDPLGTGLGAKPICNTDVFCFAPPDFPADQLPPGVLHPSKVMEGVVAGVRDYGNRMGIPTINGAVCFDKRYLANPLVYCGTVGVIPVDRVHKEPQVGDLIVAVGGRTGRDGIHGATFSSEGLTSESEEISGGAVQIGNAIMEKKVVDVILQARDENLYNAITDCGAGGFSSAVGEMGEKLGARVELERAPLKYEGLSYTEIWISEAQERMILSVPPEKWEELHSLCESEDVEATAIGEFEATGQLRLFYEGEPVADLSMSFLHEGRPDVVRQATWGTPVILAKAPALPKNEEFTDTLNKILSNYNVCSKEFIVRQYDHEVQAGTVVKPLVGVTEDGPGDASVIMPVLGSWTGLAVGCGISPQYGDLDPYQMAALAIDEAVRNVVAVGADPSRIALLDNFSWGNTDRPDVLGALVRAAEACRDVALAYNMPFISGKDSLKNEFHADGIHIVIPPTLLISAMGRVSDVRQCVTMDLKTAGNSLYLLGRTHTQMGGSHYHLAHGLEGGPIPQVDLELAPMVFAKLHDAIRKGLVRSCHDLSEGGLAVAVAEMAFAGGIGVEVVNLAGCEDEEPDPVELFAESPSRFIVEVTPENAETFEKVTEGVPHVRVGKTVEDAHVRIAGLNGQWIVSASLEELKEAWQKPLRR